MGLFRLGISPYTALRNALREADDTLYYFHFFIQRTQKEKTADDRKGQRQWQVIT